MPLNYPQRRQNLVYGGKSGFIGYLMIRPPGPWRMYWKTLEGLVLWMDFNQCQAIDLSGHGNNGTIYGAQCVRGRSGKALSFDGVDDYVKVNSESLNITGAITISVWVYYKENSSKWPAFVSKWNIGRGYLLWQRVNLKIAFGVWDESGTAHCAGEITLTEGWHHLVGVYDPSLPSDNVKVYVDGKQTGDISDFTGKISVSSNPLYIGRVADQYFDASIDEVRIYNRALSEKEIKWLYEHT